MGSRSDLESLTPAREVLDLLQIPHEARVLSAHRTPDALFAYIDDAEKRGVLVFIAGAGGAAHLPGVIAAKTLCPVLGVPIPSTALFGLDALLSIVQMPKGIPVATFAVGKPGAGNAALFAAAIVGQTHPDVMARLREWREAQSRALVAQQVIE